MAIPREDFIGNFLHDIIISDQLLSFHATIYPEKNTWVRLSYGSLDSVIWAKSGEGFVETLRELAKDTKKDCWVSLAEYKKSQIGKMSVALIKCNFLRIPYSSCSSCDKLTNEILSYSERFNMKPTVIVDAIDECYVEWFYYKPMKRNNIEQWRRMQEKLCKLFSRFNPVLCCDPNIMLRVTGFRNNGRIQ